MIQQTAETNYQALIDGGSSSAIGAFLRSPERGVLSSLEPRSEYCARPAGLAGGSLPRAGSFFPSPMERGGRWIHNHLPRVPGPRREAAAASHWRSCPRDGRAGKTVLDSSVSAR